MQRWLESVVLIVLAALAIGGAARAASAADMVVLGASPSSNVAVGQVPAAGTSCAEALKSLKAANFKITDVQGGGGLAYTLEGGKPNQPAVVIVICGVTAPSDGGDVEVAR